MAAPKNSALAHRMPTTTGPVLIETLATRRVEFHYIQGIDVHADLALQRPATVTFSGFTYVGVASPFFYTVLCAARLGWCLAAMPMNTISSSQGL